MPSPSDIAGSSSAAGKGSCHAAVGSPVSETVQAAGPPPAQPILPPSDIAGSSSAVGKGSCLAKLQTAIQNMRDAVEIIHDQLCEAEAKKLKATFARVERYMIQIQVSSSINTEFPTRSRTADCLASCDFDRIYRRELPQ